MKAKNGGIKCPECGRLESYVMESRQSIVQGTSIPAQRRRHECIWCDHRWTTYELDGENLRMLVKTASIVLKGKPA